VLTPLAWIHPVFGMTTVTLIILAYWAKRRQQPYYRLHYILGGSGVLLGLGAVGLGVVTVWGGLIYEAGLSPISLIILRVKMTLAFSLGLLLLTQGTLGVLMATGSKSYSKLWKWHRPIGHTIFTLALLLAAGGFWTLFSVLTIAPERLPTEQVQPYNY